MASTLGSERNVVEVVDTTNLERQSDATFEKGKIATVVPHGRNLDPLEHDDFLELSRRAGERALLPPANPRPSGISVVTRSEHSQADAFRIALRE
jgi:hypothetical protein